MSTLKSRAVIGSVLVAGVLAAGAGGFVVANAVHDEDPAPTAAEVETANAEQTDLHERVEVKGALGYGPAQTVGTELSGTLTSVASPGSTVKPGEELMRLDDRPVVAMRGKLPAWRTFELGMPNGRDVEQLEQNLADLDYFSGTPDQRFDAATATAIGRWQKDLGLPQTQQIERGRVVFLPSDVRVNKRLTEAGSPASDGVLEVTDTRLFATAEVQTAQQDLLTTGQEVTVRLPNGDEAEGVVEQVDPAVEKEDDSGKTSVTIPVRVALKDPSVAASYANVPVTVVATRTVAEDVLTVPVRALLAQSGGGYAVDVVDGDTVQRVPIKVGKFADEMVEVTSGELAAGDKVAVAE
ncbi:efflux RND transporter periplasmic adaptor subunit [Auritidibacter ignavus]|uniref:efflux RND transporter periplasmic adaptor subunit n=1 Tax=Auritidibacter ignavus TaxID=678932 RepID=UPI0024BA0474|nr:peptidoglycan-binding protein [Auritidibacter ignavus]WHS35832.1 peptidoglycan-binding protein [Auritidibacter ignavus]